MSLSSTLAVLAVASTAVTAAVLPGNSTTEKRADTYCIDFSGNIGWYYSLTGDWGDASAPGGFQPSQICVPTAEAGGAMYFGGYVSLPHSILSSS